MGERATASINNKLRPAAYPGKKINVMQVDQSFVIAEVRMELIYDF